VFDGNVRGLLDGNGGLARIILPLLEAWRDIRKRAADVDRQLLAAARESQATKLLMTIPGADSDEAAPLFRDDCAP
jgi:error-prone DNA polymerase